MKKIRLKLWGVRGSSPVSGKDFLQFGGETTCYEIETEKIRIVIDAGTGIRALGLKLVQEKKPKPLHLFFTHYHLDHICGLPHFRPLFRKNYPITFHLPKFSSKNPQKILENYISPPFFPKSLRESSAQIRYQLVTEQNFQVADVKILPMKMQHPGGAMGYRFNFSSQKSITIVSDNEILPENLKKLNKWCSNSDILLHDAQYLQQEYRKKVGWGHSTIENVLQLSKNAHVKKVLLSHHDPSRTDKQLLVLQNEILQDKDIHKQKINCQFSTQLAEFFV